VASVGRAGSGWARRLSVLLGLLVVVALAVAYLQDGQLPVAGTSSRTPGSSGPAESGDTALASPSPSVDWTTEPTWILTSPSPSVLPTQGPTNQATTPPSGGGGSSGGGSSGHTVALGAFIPGAPADPSKIDAYKTLTGTMPRIVAWYQAWAGQWNAFDAAGASAVRARGAMPFVSWEPSAGVATDPTWTLASIIDGKHDAYIKSWTHAVAAWGHPIYVRLMHEMNGPWQPWGAMANGNSPSEFIPAWRHIVDIARAEGATNIRWVWCPNIDNGGTYVPYGQLYPGDSYVNWIGLDGFNWGTDPSDPRWRSITTTFQISITAIHRVSSKPLLIGETASNGVSYKATWILQDLGNIGTLLPSVKAVIWYDQKDQGVDWRVNSSSVALSAFKKVAASHLFSGHL